MRLGGAVLPVLLGFVLRFGAVAAYYWWRASSTGIAKVRAHLCGVLRFAMPSPNHVCNAPAHSWFSPPHVLAISISHDMWALICNIWVAAATSFTLTCLDYMYKRMRCRVTRLTFFLLTFFLKGSVVVVGRFGLRLYCSY